MDYGVQRFGEARKMSRDDTVRPALLPLEEVTRRLRAYERRYLGLRAIRVRQIVGTDSRGGDFDREFRPLRPAIVARMRRVEQAFPHNDFPPIIVYQLGDAYFVVDGHHRVAVARQRGLEAIDADVTRLRARWRLSADDDLVEVIHAEQRQMFVEQSGLARARPDAEIRFSRPAGYLKLLENVQIHGYHLMLAAGRALSRREIAGDWYDRVYLPPWQRSLTSGSSAHARAPPRPTCFLTLFQRRRDMFANQGCQALVDVARGWRVESRDGERRGLRRLRRR